MLLLSFVLWLGFLGLLLLGLLLLATIWFGWLWTLGLGFFGLSISTFASEAVPGGWWMVPPPCVSLKPQPTLLFVG